MRALYEKVWAFLEALWVFLLMYRDGFWWSENTHTEKDEFGTHRWGFYRFWHGPAEEDRDILDVDFMIRRNGTGGFKGREYFHVHFDEKEGYRRKL